LCGIVIEKGITRSDEHHRPECDQSIGNGIELIKRDKERLIKILLVLLMLTNPFSDKQIKSIQEPLHEYNIFAGVTGSGKSHIANVIWYDYICNTAPRDSLLIQSGNTAESLYDNVTRQLMELDRGINWLEYKSEQHRTRLFCRRRGIEVVCIGASDETAKDRIHGKNIAGWYGDEITLQPKSFVEMAMSRCRMKVGNTLRPSPIIWTCNPDFPTHYIKVQYMDNPKLDVKNWTYDFKDNPLADDYFIENQKKKYTGVFYERMIMGRWAMAEGLIYTFNRSENIISGNDLDHRIFKDYVIGVDWGYIHPLVILFIGITGDGQYYVLDELYCREQLINQDLANKIKDRWYWDKVSVGYGDPSRPDYILQLSELLGIPIVEAENEVQEGIHEVSKAFQQRGNKEYGLYILDHCTNFKNELDGYRRGRDKYGNMKEEPIKENDDGCDAARYVIYSRRFNADVSFLQKMESASRSKNLSWVNSGV
jgi:phage terminase large subunit